MAQQDLNTFVMEMSPEDFAIVLAACKKRTLEEKKMQKEREKKEKEEVDKQKVNKLWQDYVTKVPEGQQAFPNNFFNWRVSKEKSSKNLLEKAEKVAADFLASHAWAAKNSETWFNALLTLATETKDKITTEKEKDPLRFFILVKQVDPRPPYATQDLHYQAIAFFKNSELGKKYFVHWDNNFTKLQFSKFKVPKA